MRSCVVFKYTKTSRKEKRKKIVLENGPRILSYRAISSLRDLKPENRQLGSPTLSISFQ